MIIGAHGVNGELKVRPFTDEIEQFDIFKEVFLGDETRPHKIRSCRYHAGNVLIGLAGISDRESGARLRGLMMRVPGQVLRPLDEGEFFLYQVIGLEARTEDGVIVGKVIDLIETGATDVFVIAQEDSSGQMLLPYRPDVVLSIDPGQGVMTVRPLEYLE